MYGDILSKPDDLTCILNIAVNSCVGQLYSEFGGIDPIKSFEAIINKDGKEKHFEGLKDNQLSRRIGMKVD